MKKNGLLIIGCGAIGEALYQQLDETRWDVSGLRRNASALPAGVTALQADISKRKQLADVVQSHAENNAIDFVLISLTPAAFTEQAYRGSYIEGLENTLAALSERTIQHIFFVSSTSVYGEANGDWVDETSIANPDGFSGRTMLACEQMLQASQWRCSSLRCGGIYHSRSTRIAQRLQGGGFSLRDSFTNRIHRYDVASAIAHLLSMCVEGRPLAELYNFVDDEPCSTRELETWFATRLGLSVPDEPTIPPATQRSAANKRCSNTRLRETGFEFRFPSYREGYDEALRSDAS